MRLADKAVDGESGGAVLEVVEEVGGEASAGQRGRNTRVGLDRWKNESCRRREESGPGAQSYTRVATRAGQEGPE